MPHFPFFKLPLELRKKVYQLVLKKEKNEIIITRTMLNNSEARCKSWSLSVLKRQIDESPPSELKRRLQNNMYLDRWESRKEVLGGKDPASLGFDDELLYTKSYYILLANREISAEAKEYLYRNQNFIFPSLDVMLDWLSVVGPCKRYITHMTCEKSGHRLVRKCYRLLSSVDSLQYFKITLPASLRADIDEHIDTHYEELKQYLLARNADKSEALRRLNGVHFAIGKEQLGVLDANSAPIREMTPELEEACKVVMRSKLRVHFA